MLTALRGRREGGSEGTGANYALADKTSANCLLCFAQLRPCAGVALVVHAANDRHVCDAPDPGVKKATVPGITTQERQKLGLTVEISFSFSP